MYICDIKNYHKKINMKKINLFLSMVAFVSFVAITPVSAQNAPKTTTTTQPAAKKACCADAATCTKGKDCKACPADKAKACPNKAKKTAPKAK